ncbi:hypothetical protein [Terrimonas sp.]|uniref:hypothetical protein n=1 Tax=Terrimonas sp. TaxID=1914338 RepID=UPI0010575BE9|nr:hypothetical protein [Terrimonas sp.]
MRHVQLLALAFMCLLSSCKKDNEPKGKSGDIIGKWKIERKEEIWGVNGTPENKAVDCEWVEFGTDGEFIERFTGDYQVVSRWSLLGNGNLEITASTNIPGSPDGLIIKSLSDKSMHLYYKGLFGSFYTEVTYNLYLVRL